MAAALDTLRDDTETMTLHCSGAADTSEETLLDAPLELDNSNARGWLDEAQMVRSIENVVTIKRYTHCCDLDWDFSDGEPGNDKTVMSQVS